MFARISCPACSHKFSVPEAAMGKRQSCPNCQSYFVAGKSTVEPAAPAAATGPASASTAPGFNKTMLADTSPAIRFNCPRCKKPIEAPASEAGTKMACPGCSQRLQVPAAPAAAAPAPAPAPAINKTMLVDSGPPIRYNCPACKKPLEAGSSEALTKKPCPACGQRHQVPAGTSAPPKNNLNKTMLATDSPAASFPTESAPNTTTVAGSSASQRPAETPVNHNMKYMIGGAVLLAFMIFVVPAIVNGGKHEDLVAKMEHERKIEQLKNEVDQRRAEFDRQKQFEAETKRQLDDMANKFRTLQDRTQDRFTDLIRTASDEKARQLLQNQLDAEQRKLAEERRENEKAQQRILEEAKAKLEESKRALDAASQKQQTIIQQPPPPPIYYPMYHPRYYYWW